MKNYSLPIKLVICCGFGLMHSPSWAQSGRVLSATQLSAVVKTDVADCTPPSAQTKSGLTDTETIIPTANKSEITVDRIKKTLNGIWRGQVIGDDSHVNVDYYWIMDMTRGQGLIIAQRSGKDTLAARAAAMPQALAAVAPKLTYLLCVHPGYIPSKPNPQVHEFTKVSDNLDDTPGILQQSTGLKLAKAKPTLSEIWQGLVAMGYFSNPRFADDRGIAYAGALVKETIQPVASAVGPASISLRLDGEYRGGGQTSIQWTNDVPVTGVEHAEFVGTTTSAGDFLVSTPGNGKTWKVEAIRGANYDLAWDKVILGPLANADVQPSGQKKRK
jgi:hypothetical protein